jgi:hypothetical protein
MEIERSGQEVIGRADYDGRGYKSVVIRLLVQNGEITVGSSICLPVRYQQAKLVLACFAEAVEEAEEMLNEETDEELLERIESTIYTLSERHKADVLGCILREAVERAISEVMYRQE